MKTSQYIYTLNNWDTELDLSLDSENTLVLVFASPNISSLKEPLDKLIEAFPKSKVMGCSTAGEIYANTLAEERFVVQVLKFEKTRIQVTHTKIKSSDDSYEAGQVLASILGKPKSVMVLSDGLNVNGSQLTQGLSSSFGNEVMVSGGLAGDDNQFKSTWVLVNKEAKSHYISALGFYGDSFYFGHGSEGGWSSLGLKRKVTSSSENVVYELDDESILPLYKHYLGNRSDALPSTGLLFPLGIYEEDEIKVRTILSINEENQSITFAGDVPQGSVVSLMRTSFKSLVDGAISAVKQIDLGTESCDNYCCISISCLGRKLVLGQRVEDEIEAVLDAIPSDNVMQIGFYSYGEISPSLSAPCDFYNQTMTVMLIGEY